jgi:hypothetical protein
MKKFITYSLVLMLGLFITSCSNTNKDANEDAVSNESELDYIKNNSGDAPVSADDKLITRRDAQESDYFIAHDAVGDFNIGGEQPNTIPNTYTIKKETISLMSEGEEYEESIYKVMEDGKEVFTYKLGYDDMPESELPIENVEILSGKYRTTENIGVNSTIDEFIAAYPDYKIWYSYVGDIYVIETANYNAQFLIGENDFIGTHNSKSDTEELEKSDFKEGAKIIKIKML